MDLAMLTLLAATAAAALATESPRRPMPPRDRAIISAAIGARLRDGESARYRWPDEYPDGAIYCGFYNAKNAFGAYVGFLPFMILGVHANGPRGDGRYIVSEMRLATEDPDDAASGIVRRMCAENGFDLSQIPPA